MHLGRSTKGHSVEDGCPCGKAPCGLVDEHLIDETCPHHPIDRHRTMRQIHGDANCPGNHG